MSKPVELIVIGAGSRGTGYANYTTLHPERANVVGVAEPRAAYRQRLVQTQDIAAENIFDDWQKMATRDKFADAVLITTPDALHTEPAIVFANQGYHVLLEKPMASNAADCRRIVDASTANGIILAVCHVLRYTTYTQKLKAVIESGLIGDIVSIQHFEPVGYWHQAHSFVRGNWRNESLSSSMLLQKSGHDLDWLRYIMGCRCLKVSSFGSLIHFKKENQPAEAADRCLECTYEPQCPYSAKKIYLDWFEQTPHPRWPYDVLTLDLTLEGITAALRDGPYGRCVYACDNDVVDNQVVNLLFEGGKTATFTMTAFNRQSDRKTRIFGTLGELYGDGAKIERYDFLTDETHIINTHVQTAASMGGHGGGDYGLMDNFVSAVATNNPGQILSGAAESLETHLMVFAAEDARRNHCVMDVI